MSFYDLPDKIITELIMPKLNLRTFISLSLTCKRYNNLAKLSKPKKKKKTYELASYFEDYYFDNHKKMKKILDINYDNFICAKYPYLNFKLSISKKYYYNLLTLEKYKNILEHLHNLELKLANFNIYYILHPNDYKLKLSSKQAKKKSNIKKTKEKNESVNEKMQQKLL